MAEFTIEDLEADERSAPAPKRRAGDVVTAPRMAPAPKSTFTIDDLEAGDLPVTTTPVQPGETVVRVTPNPAPPGPATMKRTGQPNVPAPPAAVNLAEVDRKAKEFEAKYPWMDRRLLQPLARGWYQAGAGVHGTLSLRQAEDINALRALKPDIERLQEIERTAGTQNDEYRKLNRDLVKRVRKTTLTNFPGSILRTPGEIDRLIEERKKGFSDSISDTSSAVTKLSKTPANPRIEAALKGDTSNFFRQLGKDPGIVTDVALQSLVQALPAIGIGMVNPASGALVMGGTTLTTEQGLALVDVLAKSGVDVTNPEAVKAAMQDPATVAKIREKANARSLPIAVIDALTMGVATKIARGAAGVPTSVGRVGAGVAAGTAADAVGGSAGELIAQLFDEGKINWPEVLMEGIAEGPGGALSVFTQGHREFSRARDERRAATEQPAAGVDPRDLQSVDPVVAGMLSDPEIRRVLDANNIDPNTSAGRAAAAKVAERRQAEGERPAPTPDDPVKQRKDAVATAKSAAKVIEKMIDLERARVQQQTEADKARAAGQERFADPTTGEETNTAFVPPVRRQAPPDIIEAGARTGSPVSIQPGADPSAVGLDPDIGRTLETIFGRDSADPGAEAGRVAATVSEQDKALIQSVFGILPPAIEHQRRLLNVINQQGAQQTAADMATRDLGPFRVSDTSGEGRTDAASRPKRTGGVGDFENTRARKAGVNQTATGASDRPFRATATRSEGAAFERIQEARLEQDTRTTFEKMKARNEEDLRAEWAKRRRYREQAEARARQRYAGQKARADDVSSGAAQAQRDDGSFDVDEDGLVRSDKGGPIRFKTQKDAARWIMGEGRKSDDQVFEIANHPVADGEFTVYQRHRRPGRKKPGGAAPKDDKPKGGDPKSTSGQTKTTEPKQIEPPRKAIEKPAEKAQEADTPKTEAPAKAEEKPTESGKSGLTPRAREIADKYAGDLAGMAKAHADARAAMQASVVKITDPTRVPDVLQAEIAEKVSEMVEHDAAAQYLAQTEEERAASSIAGTFYSNPAFDPRLWRTLGSLFRLDKFVKALGPGIAKEMDAWSERSALLGDAAFKAQRPDGAPKKGENSVAHVARLIAHSNDGHLRVLAHAFGVDGKPNPHIMDFARQWFAEPGNRKEGAVGQTFGEEIAERTQTRLNDIMAILKPLAETPKGSHPYTRPRREAILRAVAAKLRSGKLTRNPQTTVDRIANDLHDFFKAELEHLRKAGVDIGEVKNGYLPAELDIHTVLNEADAFRTAAAKAYRTTGMNAKDAQAAAEEWYQRILMRDMGTRFDADANDFAVAPSGTGRSNFEKGRKFGPEAQKILERFYIQDPVELAHTYTVRATRRAAFARVMGPEMEKWKALKRDLEATGAQGAVGDIVQMVRSMAGLYSVPAHPAVRTLTSLGRLMAPLTFLERATVTSLTEPIIIGMRTHSVSQALTGYLRTLKEIAHRVAGHPSASEELGQILGIAGSADHGLVMEQRFGGQLDSKVAQTIASEFFKKTFLHGFTDSSRVAALHHARGFVRSLVKKLDTATTSKLWGTKESRAFFLEELGVPRDKQAAFAEWAMARNDGMPNADRITLDAADSDENARLYRTAMTRFVDQTVMRPNAAMRPRWAQHPVGAIFYSITSFIYAFHKQQVKRTVKLAGDALNPATAYSLYERGKLMMPMAIALGLMIPAQYALTYLRDEIWDDPAKDPKKKKEMDEPFTIAGIDTGLTKRWWLSISRSGMMGTLDIPFNWLFATKYRKDPATVLAGPVVGGIMELAKGLGALVGQDNSPKTNSAERTAARVVYDLVVSPVMNAAFAILPGKAGFAIGATGIQVTSGPKVREIVVKGIAGPPRWQQRSSGGYR